VVYRSDANLVVPPDDTPLWRYLDFARFMALLDSASLWFARADTFSDQYELAVPAADMAAARSGAAAILADGRTHDGVVHYLAAAADRPAGELAGFPDSEIAGPAVAVRRPGAVHIVLAGGSGGVRRNVGQLRPG
jgi:hypothetical protein